MKLRCYPCKVVWSPLTWRIQAEHQRQATRLGPVVRCMFLPGQAWRPAVGARLAQTLGRTKSHHHQPEGEASMIQSIKLTIVLISLCLSVPVASQQKAPTESQCK
jgi:hypothetical protein